MENKINAIGYVRVSTDRQADKVFSSIDAQQNIIREYAQNKGGYNLIRIFNDTKSAKDMNRPAMQELIKFIKEFNVDVIISYRLDRISRDKFDYYGFEKFLKENSVRLIYTDDINVDESSTGEFYRDVSVAAVSYERKKTIERVKDKYAQAVKVGYHPGGYAPIGYQAGPEPKTIVILPENATQIRHIFDRFFEEKISMGEIALEMNKKYGGTPIITLKNGKRRGGRRYTETFVRRILGNPIYAGYTYLKGREGFQLFEGRHEGIIDRDIWHQIQEKLKLIKDKHSNKSLGVVLLRERNPYILKKILYCSCGYAMTVGTSGKKLKDGSSHFYYVCVRKRKEQSLCECKTAISLKIIENVVFSALAYIATRDISIETLRSSNNEYKNSIEAEKEQLTKDKSYLTSEIRKGTSRLLEMEDDCILYEEMKSILKSKSERLARINSRLEQINSELELLGSGFNVGRAQIESTLENLEAFQSEMTIEEKRAVLHSVVKKMVLNCVEIKNPKKLYSLTIFPKEEYSEKLGIFEIRFDVDNSLGKGYWKISSPFELCCDSNRVPIPSNTKRQYGRHFIHEVIRWHKKIEESGVSIREFSKDLNVQHAIVARKIKLLSTLSNDAIEFLVKIRYADEVKKFSFRKVEEISKMKKYYQYRAMKKLLISDLGSPNR